jgi:hypothetical protein
MCSLRQGGSVRLIYPESGGREGSSAASSRPAFTEVSKRRTIVFTHTQPGYADTDGRWTQHDTRTGLTIRFTRCGCSAEDAFCHPLVKTRISSVPIPRPAVAVKMSHPGVYSAFSAIELLFFSQAFSGSEPNSPPCGGKGAHGSTEQHAGSGDRETRWIGRPRIEQQRANEPG